MRRRLPCDVRIILCAGVAGAAIVAAAGARADMAGDPRDRPVLSTVLNRALETERTNVEIPWSNPETGNHGVIVIERTYYRDPRTPCRVYRRTVERPGASPEVIRAEGCRIGPAVWTLDETAAAVLPPAAPAKAAGTTVSTPQPAPAEPAATTKPDPDVPAASTAAASAKPASSKRTRSSSAASATKQSVAEKPEAKSSAKSTAPAAPAAPDYTLPSKTAL